MRTVSSPILLLVSLTCFANSAPVSEADLKNLLASIRQNRITQADFQEQRMIRLMKNPNPELGKEPVKHDKIAAGEFFFAFAKVGKLPTAVAAAI